MYKILVLLSKLYKLIVQLSNKTRKKMKIAENIKFYRKTLGLTQEKLASLLNGKKSLVSNYENGYSTPDIYTLIKLADVFQVSLDELVGRKFL